MVACAMPRFFFALLFAATMFAAPIPELVMQDGRVLKNVEFISYNPTVVVAKWEGGRGFLKYEDFPAEWQTKLSAYRPKSVGGVATVAAPPAKPVPSAPAVSPEKPATPAAPVAPTARKISGEAFLTGGESGAIRVKFAGITVTAYPLVEALAALDSRLAVPELPAPLAVADADSEGRFAFELPPNTPFLLLAKAEHHAIRGGRITPFEWAIKSTEIRGDTIMLTEKNATAITVSTINRR